MLHFLISKFLVSFLLVVPSWAVLSSKMATSGRKYANSLVLLPLPAGDNKMEILMSNDDVITKAVKETYTNLFVYVYFVGDRAPTLNSMNEYVSDIYSRTWDEMVQARNLELDCVVIGEQGHSLNVSQRLNWVINIDEWLLSNAESLSAVYIHRNNASNQSSAIPDRVLSFISPIDSSRMTLSALSEVGACESGSNRAQEIAVLVSAVPDVLVGTYYYEDPIYDQNTPVSAEPASRKSFPTYRKVAMGGSFDHLHNGHRKLLYLAGLACTEVLTIGITGDSMLASKSRADLISCFAVRSQGVRDFMTKICPQLPLNIVELTDPFGPTITDHDIQAIVVSSETLLGAKKINSIRAAASMAPLDILVTRRSDGAVLSSSFIRNQLV